MTAAMAGIAADPSAGAPFLSIVTPTFRREGRLPALFDALAAQVAASTVSVELVLVDNAPEGSAAGVPRPGFVRYVHEPRAGVAHARNRGVAEAAGRHVIFLDDDELPDAGWLASFAAVAGEGRVYFGAIEPAFDAPPPPAIRAPLDRLFSRRFPAIAQDTDISGYRAFLGSGNSLFDRRLLTAIDPPFDVGFNDGGEDVFLFRHLVDDHGVVLRWRSDAVVREIVPAARCTVDYVRGRVFRNGQLRCAIEADAGGVRGPARVAWWMAIGAVQVVVGSVSALVLRPVSAARAVRMGLVAAAGSGKVCWWRDRPRRGG